MRTIVGGTRLHHGGSTMSMNNQGAAILLRLGVCDESGIAEFLEANHVRGRRNNVAYCVLANYLKREIGAEAVEVHCKRTEIAGKTIQNPFSVRMFLKLFDAGLFPTLETANNPADMDGQIVSMGTSERVRIIPASKQVMQYLEPWAYRSGGEPGGRPRYVS